MHRRWSTYRARIPVSHLGLDVDEPMSGWLVFFAERGVEVVEDDLGRPSVLRRVLGELLAEREVEEARVAAHRAELATAQEAPIPVGVPAVGDASPYESLVAAGGVVTPQQEFGGGRTSVHEELLDERFNEGRKQAADAEAEAEAVASARRLLDGRDE
jgi:hypothetical protein